LNWAFHCTIKLPSSEFEVLDMTKADEKLSAEIRDANSLLMAYLLNACKKKGDTQKAMNTQDDDLPSGQAWKVMVSLDKKYHPKDIHTELELENKLNGVSMNPRDNPDEPFEQIEDIEGWYSTRSKKQN
jgi:hypothetical protein